WEGKCPLTDIAEPGLLRASHIIAWSACADEADRLDPENGLILSALWDAAFDRGLVSFDAGGEAVAYPKLGAAARDALNLAGVPRLKRLSAGNRARLAVHRGWCASGVWPEGA
ncbi:MAG: HNH endonuclease, partial [Sandaracinobacter sp.]